MKTPKPLIVWVSLGTIEKGARAETLFAVGLF